MKHERSGAAAGVVSSNLHVCGGFDEFYRERKSVECFDPLAEQWQLLRAMNLPRSRAAAAVVAGLLYVCGGTSSDQIANSSVECYDPTLDVWTVSLAMEFERDGSVAIPLMI